MTLRRVPNGSELPDYKEPYWQWLNDPPTETAILDLDGGPVSCCRLFPRHLRSPDCDFTVLGIGGVYTPEDQRHRGYATMMLSTLFRQWSLNDGVAAVLYANRARSLYRRLGFTEVQRGLYVLPMIPGLVFHERDELLDIRPWHTEPIGHF